MSAVVAFRRVRPAGAAAAPQRRPRGSGLGPTIGWRPAGRTGIARWWPGWPPPPRPPVAILPPPAPAPPRPRLPVVPRAVVPPPPPLPAWPRAILPPPPRLFLVSRKPAALRLISSQPLPR